MRESQNGERRSPLRRCFPTLGRLMDRLFASFCLPRYPGALSPAAALLIVCAAGGLGAYLVASWITLPQNNPFPAPSGDPYNELPYALAVSTILENGTLLGALLGSIHWGALCLSRACPQQPVTYIGRIVRWVGLSIFAGIAIAFFWSIAQFVQEIGIPCALRRAQGFDPDGTRYLFSCWRDCFFFHLKEGAAAAAASQSLTCTLWGWRRQVHLRRFRQTQRSSVAAH